jgi:CheY-specific phosphatase CheX
MTIPGMPADTRPVAQDVREQLLEPFIRGVRAALGEMAGVEVAVHSVYQTSEFRRFDDVAAVVELGGATPRWLVISLTEQTATALAGRLLPTVTEDDRGKLLQDFTGEIANIVARQAKTALAASSLRITCSLPKVADASATSPIPEHCVNGIVVVFDSAAGGLGMRLILVS